MSTRTLLWTFGALVVALVVGPLVAMLVTPAGTMGYGMMGGGMAMMHVGGMAWMILIVVAIAALVALLVRSETRT